MTDATSLAYPAPAGANRSTGMLLLAFDLAFVCIAFAASADLFNRFGISSPVWMLLYAMLFARIATTPTLFLNLFARNGAFFLFAFVCGLSTIWSLLPSRTLGASLQLTVTIALGLYAGRRFDARVLCLLLFAVSALMGLMSVLNLYTGVFGTVYAGGGGLLGVFNQKNILGKACLIGLLSGTTVLLMRGIPLAIKAATLLFMGVLALALLRSQSVTSILLTPVFAGLIVVLCYRSLPRSVTLFAVMAGVVFVSLAPLASVIAGFDPVTEILGSFNKNTTLTGRTELWAIARSVAEDYPLLGVGYSAFWDAPRFASLAYLAQSIGGESIRAFHNFVLEIWVATGVLGVFAIGVFTWTALSRTLRTWLLTRLPEDAFAVSLVLSTVTVALLEPDYYRQHTSSIFLVVMVAAGAQRRRALVFAARRAGASSS